MVFMNLAIISFQESVIDVFIMMLVRYAMKGFLTVLVLFECLTSIMKFRSLDSLQIIQEQNTI